MAYRRNRPVSQNVTAKLTADITAAPATCMLEKRPPYATIVNAVGASTAASCDSDVRSHQGARAGVRNRARNTCQAKIGADCSVRRQSRRGSWIKRANQSSP